MWERNVPHLDHHTYENDLSQGECFLQRWSGQYKPLAQSTAALLVCKISASASNQSGLIQEYKCSLGKDSNTRKARVQKIL